MSRHAPCENFTLNDLVGGFAADHALPGELLTTRRTAQIAVGSIFEDTFDKTFDEAPGAALAVFVQQSSAT